jgi:hypothetical protein
MMVKKEKHTQLDTAVPRSAGGRRAWHARASPEPSIYWPGPAAFLAALSRALASSLALRLGEMPCFLVPSLFACVELFFEVGKSECV